MTTENIEVTALPNGVRVVSETVGHVQSVSLGIWVGVGARDEERPLRGISHFIEHMLFKGTRTRDARQIADEIESRGGSLNAFTDKEYTCFYARSLDEHVGLGMDVLCDMLLNSALDAAELDREKGVVIEEIRRYKDTPEDLVHELFAETLWSTHPLGRPVIGSEKTVAALGRGDLTGYLGTHYTPDRIVVSAAGNVTHAQVVDLAQKYLGGVTGAPYVRRSRAPRASGRSRTASKRTEQVHFCLGTPGYSQLDDDRYVLSILDTVLGGNMSSRLFQEIREKRGLAYSIGSYAVSYREGGMFAVYGGTGMETYNEVIDLTRAELDKVRRENLTDEEIAKAKTQIRGGMVLSLENMSNRMMRMGKSMLYFGRVIPLDEVMGKITRVSSGDIDRVANEVLDDSRLTLAAVGPFRSRKAAA